MRSRSVVTTSSCASSTLDELRPLLERLVDAREAAQAQQVRRLDLEDLAVRLRGLLRVAACCLVERADAQLRAPRSRAGSVERLHLAGEDVDELLVLAARGVDALEVLERRDEQRVDLERALEVRRRA